jgi:cytochrome c551/c552
MNFPRKNGIGSGLARLVPALPRVALLALAVLQWSVPPAHGQDGLNGGQLAATYCLACHQVDRKIVGPSFVEIAGIHRDNPDGIVEWAINPGKKRPDAIQMPSMAFLGEENLRKIADYILKEAEGKTEVQAEDGSSAAIPSLVDAPRPKVQRIFMPDAGPAAIAVAMPGSLSYCWDAGNCQLRYVWKGDFIDPWPVWKGNGNGLATIMGDILFKPDVTASPRIRSEASPVFLGYRLIQGLPEFRYTLGDLEITELVKPLPADQGFTQIFSVRGADKPVLFSLQGRDGLEVEASTGTIDGDVLTVSPLNARSVSIHTILEN